MTYGEAKEGPTELSEVQADKENVYVVPDSRTVNKRAQQY